MSSTKVLVKKASFRESRETGRAEVNAYPILALYSIFISPENARKSWVF